jgi:3-hydroxybutyrate dehydrogenase
VLNTPRNALITGAANKLAVAFAESLAKTGYGIMMSDPDASSAMDTLVDKLQTASQRPCANHPADPTDGAGMAELVEATVRSLGSVDVLINAAAKQYVAPLEQVPDSVWHEILATNLTAAFYTTRAALPHMRKRGWGRIINQASVHGLVASPNKAAYVASKHGMMGLTKVTALETAGSGITCNAICPGFTGTESTMQQAEDIAREQNQSLEEATKVLLARQPSGQWVSVEGLGALVVFICSNAADQMTGVSLPVEGGWTAQ